MVLRRNDHIMIPRLSCMVMHISCALFLSLRIVKAVICVGVIKNIIRDTGRLVWWKGQNKRRWQNCLIVGSKCWQWRATVCSNAANIYFFNKLWSQRFHTRPKVTSIGDLLFTRFAGKKWKKGINQSYFYRYSTSLLHFKTLFLISVMWLNVGCYVEYSF